jgi:hypothetical protein
MSVSRNSQTAIVIAFADRCRATGISFDQAVKWETSVAADHAAAMAEEAKRHAENEALRRRYYEFRDTNPDWHGSDADLAHELGVDVTNLRAVRQAQGVIRWARISAMLSSAKAAQ